MKKFLHNLGILTAVALTALAAAPASADDFSVVSLKSGMALSAVYDPTKIAMPQLPGGQDNLGFESNPAFFQGASFCLSGQNDNWALRDDGTVDEYNKARKPHCTTIDANGQVRISNPFGDKAVPFLGADTNGDGTVDRIIAWAGRNRLNGVLPY